MGRHQRKLTALRNVVSDLLSARRCDRDRIRSLDERLRERRDSSAETIQKLERRIRTNDSDYRWLSERYDTALDRKARAESAHAKTLDDLRRCQAWLLIAAIVALVLGGCVLHLRHELTVSQRTAVREATR